MFPARLWLIPVTLVAAVATSALAAPKQGQYLLAARIAATRANCLTSDLKLIEKTVDTEVYVTRDARNRKCIVVCLVPQCSVSFGPKLATD